MNASVPDIITEPVFGFWSSRPFKSAKTPAVIQAETRLHEDYLSVASLEEGVTEIRAAPPGLLGMGASPDFEVTEEGGRSHLVFLMPSDAPPERREEVLAAIAAAGRKGFDCRVVEEADVMEEPRLRNVRLVFGCRRTRVSPGDRVRILHHLGECSGRSTLIEVAKACAAQQDAVECVLALVVEGTVMVDVRRTMGPEMPVWRLRTEADADPDYE